MFDFFAATSLYSLNDTEKNNLIVFTNCAQFFTTYNFALSGSSTRIRAKITGLKLKNAIFS